MNRFAKRKRGVLLGFGAATAVLTLTSTAFACTIYKGKTTVTDVNNGVTSTASADGSGGTGAHSFCGPDGQPSPVQAQQAVDLTGTFTVMVGLATVCTDNKAPQADYTINWATRKTDVPQPEVPGGLCNSAENDLVNLGSITVSSTGTGGAANNAASTPSIGPATVCLGSDLGPEAASPPEVRLLVI